MHNLPFHAFINDESGNTMCSSIRIRFGINNLFKKQEYFRIPWIDYIKKRENYSTTGMKWAPVCPDHNVVVTEQQLKVDIVMITNVLALGPLVHHILFPLKI